jgi:uncharacterized protein YprB with RNaseH-like and TPR domain
MDLRAKLARLPAPAVVRQSLIDDLRSRIRDVIERPIPVHEAGVGRTHYLEPHHHHGRIPIARALSAEAHLVAELALDPSLVRIDLSSALFLDTETTGLSNAGAVPFLIGMAWFEDQTFVVEQLFLRELGEEAPMLLRLIERMEKASCLVTYNGKTFDWPLLVNRFVLSRIGPPPSLPHVDLLHCARRIYRRRLGGVRLIDVEEQVMGMRRERDIDGSEIPSLYWTYLRHKNETAIEPIIEHNANDLIALAALLAHLSERFAKVYAEDDPIDQLARAKLAFRAKDEARARTFAEAAGEGGGEPDITVEAYALLALIRKRAGDVPGAERELLLALEASKGDAALAAPIHLELAKLYEHRIKDFERALSHALTAGETAHETAKRTARLERRIRRHHGVRRA